MVFTTLSEQIEEKMQNAYQMYGERSYMISLGTQIETERKIKEINDLNSIYKTRKISDNCYEVIDERFEK